MSYAFCPGKGYLSINQCTQWLSAMSIPAVNFQAICLSKKNKKAEQTVRPYIIFFKDRLPVGLKCTYLDCNTNHVYIHSIVDKAINRTVFTKKV